MVKISSEETPDSFIPLKLMKSEIRTDYNGGMCVILEFVDGNGVRLITPEIPYPEHFDPMKIEHAEYRGVEIRIKNDTGGTILSVYATSVEYDSPIPTALDPNGYMCIAPEEGEDSLPIRTFSLSQGEESQVGFSQAFEQANRARQALDNVVQSQLNSQFPDTTSGGTTLGASAWFREQQERINPNTDVFAGHREDEPIPKIKIDFDMKCTCCEGKIHYPDKLVQLLGNEGTIKYLEFCKKTGGEPQMFCCECFNIMGRNRRIITAVNKMNEKIKDMMDLKDREEAITKREEELDKQLKEKKKR